MWFDVLKGMYLSRVPGKWCHQDEYDLSLTYSTPMDTVVSSILFLSHRRDTKRHSSYL